MIHLKTLITSVILMLSLFSQAQSSYIDTIPGWTGSSAIVTNNNNLIVTSIGFINGTHQFQIILNLLNEDLTQLQSDTIIPESNYEMTFHGALSKAIISDSSFILVGSTKHFDSLEYEGIILEIGFNLKVLNSKKFNLGTSTFVQGIVIDNLNYYVLCSEFDVSSDGKILTSLIKFDDQLNVINNYSYNCDTWFSSSDYGCATYPQNLLLLSNGDLIYSLIEEPKNQFVNQSNVAVICQSKNGTIKWNYEIKNDTFSYHDIVVGYSNNQIVVFYNDTYYKPYMDPSNNPNPEPNETTSINYLLLDTNGNLIKKASLATFLYPYFEELSEEPTYQIHELSRVINTTDSGLLLTGYSYYLEDKIYDRGFALKFDKYNSPHWYRHYVKTVTPPYNLETESTKLYDVIEFNDKFLFSGEYTSYASDSFPRGAQTAIYFKTDMDGCLSSECLKLNINKKSLNKHLQPYPNPASNYLKLNIQDIEMYTIFSMKGEVIQSGSSSTSIDIQSLPNGLYSIKIIDHNGDFYHEKFTVFKD